jgi:hypothetical protein
MAPGPGVISAISTAMGDGNYTSDAEQAKIVDQIPGLLAKHGVETDAATIRKTFESTSRATAYDKRPLKEWGANPRGSTKRLTALQFLQRMVSRIAIAEQYSRSPITFVAYGSPTDGPRLLQSFCHW